jgi:hypothetical protein
VASDATAAGALQQLVLRRALAAGEPGKLHLRFDAAVLGRYRERRAQLLRTRTVGRIALAGAWSLDVGIAAEGRELHVTFDDLRQRLPESEREHWLAHLIEVPLSANFLQMRLTTSACIDDGETEAWV